LDEKTVGNIAKRNNRILTQEVRRQQNRLLKSIKDLEKRIIDVSKQLKTKDGKLEGVAVNLKQLQKVYKDVTKVVEQVYGSEVLDMLGDRDKLLGLVKKQFEDLGRSVEFAGLDVKTIEALNKRSYQDFMAFGDQARDRISEAMYGAVVSGAPYSDLLKTITGILLGHEDIRGRPMTQYVGTWAFDEVMNFHNQVTLMKAEELGMNHFLYMGDIIKTSRPFCIARAGKVYSKEEIESWNDMPWKGKRGPAMIYRGGWRCRHHWVPVEPEWIPDGKVDIQKYDFKTLDDKDLISVREGLKAEAAEKAVKAKSMKTAAKTAAAEAEDLTKATKSVSKTVEEEALEELELKHIFGRPGQVASYSGETVNSKAFSTSRDVFADELKELRKKYKDDTVILSQIDRMESAVYRSSGTDRVYFLRDRKGKLRGVLSAQGIANGQVTFRPGYMGYIDEIDLQLLFKKAREELTSMGVRRFLGEAMSEKGKKLFFDLGFKEPPLGQGIVADAFYDNSLAVDRYREKLLKELEENREKISFQTKTIERRTKHLLEEEMITEEDLNYIETKLAESMKYQNIYIRVDGKTLDKILKDGRFKSQFETGRSKGLFNPEKRRGFEKELLGIPEGLPDEMRPIYGYITSAEGGELPYSGAINQYGEIAVKLKESVKNRATFTGTDSLIYLHGVPEGEQAAVVASRVNEPKFVSLFTVSPQGTELPVYVQMSERIRDLKQLVDTSRIETLIDNFGETFNRVYIETQIQNGVAAKDIDSIYFMKSYGGDQWQKLSKTARKRILKWAKENSVKLYRNDVTEYEITEITDVEQ